MRQATPLIAAAIAGFFAPAAVAEDASRDIIDRAIKARVVQESKIEKQRVQIIIMEGHILGPDLAEIPTVREVQVDWPTQYRMSYEMAMPDGKKRVSLALSVDKAWIQHGGAPAEEMNLNRVDEFKDDVHGQWMGTLYPLKDTAIKLKQLLDSNVAGEPVSVVQASIRFRPHVFLSFSKKTGHLVKLAFRAAEAGVELRKEQFFTDFKNFDGLMLPAKRTDHQNGKKVAEWTVKSYKFIDKLEPNPFEKDEKK